jgi:hypothetical protein
MKEPQGKAALEVYPARQTRMWWLKDLNKPFV